VREAFRTKPRRVAWVAAVVVALAVLAAAVGATASRGARPNGAAASQRVALLLPENVTPRWEGFDHPTFVKALKKLMPGVTIDVLNAQNKPDTQQSQAEQEITKGAKVLVVGAIDGKAFGAVAQRANRLTQPRFIGWRQWVWRSHAAIVSSISVMTVSRQPMFASSCSLEIGPRGATRCAAYSVSGKTSLSIGTEAADLSCCSRWEKRLVI